jgi:hypothetical protein
MAIASAGTPPAAASGVGVSLFLQPARTDISKSKTMVMRISRFMGVSPCVG